MPASKQSQAEVGTHSQMPGLPNEVHASSRDNDVPLRVECQLQPCAAAMPNMVDAFMPNFLMAGREERLKQLADLANVTHSPKRNLRAWKTVPASICE